MIDLETILFLEELTPAEREEAERRLAADPEARAARRKWLRLLQEVGEQVDTSLPDRRLLILEGLRRAGRDDALSGPEREHLDDRKEVLDSALERHPGLEDVVADVAHDVQLFERAWSDGAEERRRSHSEGDGSPFAADRGARRRAARSRIQWVWRVGALAAVVAFVGLLIFMGERQSDLVSLATGPDEVRVVDLADGSSVRLMPNSELAYHSPEDAGEFTRYARLEGDAFFSIAPRREGFTVEVPTGMVVVLGTSFAVRAEESQASVYLTKGRVSLYSAANRNQPVVLEPGEMAQIPHGQLPTAASPFEASDAPDWTGVLALRETPLPEAASQLRERFDAPVVVHEDLADETVSGTFWPDQDLQEVLATLSSALSAEVDSTGGELRIVPRR